MIYIVDSGEWISRMVEYVWEDGMVGDLGVCKGYGCIRMCMDGWVDESFL